ncbi:hypothetical protein, partial [Brucella sp. NBRC 12950]|uniref:hypothetical protein n=1 Tax=Brucella sp. NBRC 12950 TaxID=2994518 RepID=UPI0025555F7C
GALHLVTASRIPGHPQEITPKTKGYTFKVDTLNCRAKKAALTLLQFHGRLDCASAPWIRKPADRAAYDPFRNHFAEIAAWCSVETATLSVKAIRERSIAANVRMLPDTVA